MDKRIKKIRRELDLTQQEFGDRIGVKRNTIATYEGGRSTPIDSVISLICREFNVNEEWLRTGSGEMFHPKPTSKLDEIFEEYGLSENERVLIKRFVNLTQEQRTAVTDFILKTAADLSSNNIATAEAAYEKSLGIAPDKESTASNTTEGTGKESEAG